VADGWLFFSCTSAGELPQAPKSPGCLPPFFAQMQEEFGDEWLFPDFFFGVVSETGKGDRVLARVFFFPLIVKNWRGPSFFLARQS